MAHLVGIGLVAGVFRSIDLQGIWPWWLVAGLCAWAARLALVRRLDGIAQVGRAVPPESVSRLLLWDNCNRLLRLVQGALTGLACAWHEPQASGLQQSTLLVVVFVWVLGAMPAMLERMELFAVHALITSGPLAVALVRDTGDADQLHLVGSALLLTGLLAWMLDGQRLVLAGWRQENERMERLRMEVSQHAALERAARVAAEVGHRAKTQLIAATSHDLRQPLLALNLYELQLRSRLCEPRDKGLLEGIARSLQSLETLLSDLLEDARQEAGAAAPALEPVALEPLFQRLASQVGPCAFDRGLHLAWRGAHHRVWADTVMLERVLRNLILNAIEHTESGGVLIGARRRGGQVILQVWDSGCGLQAHERARVFDDHYTTQRLADHPQGSALENPRPHRQGTGLGLGIVRRLSHLMGATVKLRSWPGRGTVFEVAFKGAPSTAG